MLLASMCHAMPFPASALKNIFFDIDIVLKNKIKMWFSMVCTLINSNTGHQSGQNLLWTHLAAPCEPTTL